MRRTVRLTTMLAGSAMLVVFNASPAAADIPGAQTVRDLITSPFGWAWDKVAAGIASWILGGVGDLIGVAVNELGRTTAVDVSAVWFSGPGSPYATVRMVAVGLASLFVLMGLLQGLLRGEPGFMVRQVAVSVPLAVVGTVATTWVIGHLVLLVDALSGGVLASQNGYATRFLSGFGTAAVGTTGGFAVVLIGLVAVIGSLVLWVELVVRGALVYLLVAFLPLAFAATLWPAARGLLRRSIELLAAVLFSKLVVAIALAVGVAALGGAGQAGGVANSLGTLLAGTVIVGLAAFAPFMVLRVVPAVEAAVVAHGISRMPIRSAERGVSLAMTGASVTRLATAAVTTPAAANGGTARLAGTSGPSTQPPPSSTGASRGQQLARQVAKPPPDPERQQ